LLVAPSTAHFCWNFGRLPAWHEMAIHAVSTGRDSIASWKQTARRNMLFPLRRRSPDE